MLTTKVTKKGQITIPVEYRKQLDIGIGTIVMIKRDDNKLLIEKPMAKGEIMKLKGAWKDVSEKVFKDMEKMWGRWNEKSIARY